MDAGPFSGASSSVLLWLLGVPAGLYLLKRTRPWRLVLKRVRRG